MLNLRYKFDTIELRPDVALFVQVGNGARRVSTDAIDVLHLAIGVVVVRQAEDELLAQHCVQVCPECTREVRVIVGD
jgi:hypothetical protein